MRGAGLLVLCALLGCQRRGDELIQEVSRVLADPVLRPSHIEPPLSGSFAERADPALRSIHGTRRQDLPTLARQSPQEALDATAPVVELSPEWEAELAAQRPALTALIAATTAESGRLPAPLQVFGTYDQDPPYNFIDVQQAARLLGLMAQRAVAAGSPGEALELCAGGLALARDVAAPDILGNMVGASLVGILTPSCLAATRAAAPEANRTWAKALQAIESGWRPFAAVLEDEKLFLRLVMAASDPAMRAALPLPAQRFLAAVPQDRPSGLWDTLRSELLMGPAIRENLERIDQVVAALRLPIPEADAALTRLGTESSWLMALAGDPSGSNNYLKYVRRAREAQAKLRLLAAAAAIFAAHREQQRWPTTWAEALPDRAPAPVDARTGLAFALLPAPDGPTIHAVPDGERTDADLDLRLGPR